VEHIPLPSPTITVTVYFSTSEAVKSLNDLFKRIMFLV